MEKIRQEEEMVRGNTGKKDGEELRREKKCVCCKRAKHKTWEEGGGKREIDAESGRLGESLSVSAYLSHADDDESLVKLVT